jgi:hypothetical protein
MLSTPRDRCEGRQAAKHIPPLVPIPPPIFAARTRTPHLYDGSGPCLGRALILLHGGVPAVRAPIALVPRLLRVFVLFLLLPWIPRIVLHGSTTEDLSDSRRS